MLFIVKILDDEVEILNAYNKVERAKNKLLQYGLDYIIDVEGKNKANIAIVSYDDIVMKKDGYYIVLSNNGYTLELYHKISYGMIFTGIDIKKMFKYQLLSYNVNEEKIHSEEVYIPIKKQSTPIFKNVYANMLEELKKKISELNI